MVEDRRCAMKVSIRCWRRSWVCRVFGCIEFWSVTGSAGAQKQRAFKGYRLGWSIRSGTSIWTAEGYGCLLVSFIWARPSVSAVRHGRATRRGETTFMGGLLAQVQCAIHVVLSAGGSPFSASPGGWTVGGGGVPGHASALLGRGFGCGVRGGRPRLSRHNLLFSVARGEGEEVPRPLGDARVSLFFYETCERSRAYGAPFRRGPLRPAP